MYTGTWRDVVRRDLFGPSPDPRDRPYRFVIRVVLVLFRLFGFRFDVRGSEHVPATGGAIICSNHVSFFDFMFLGVPAIAGTGWSGSWRSPPSSTTGSPAGSCGPCSTSRSTGPAPLSPPSARSRTARWSGSSPRPRSAAASPSRTSRPARADGRRRRRARHPGRRLGRAPGRHAGPQGAVAPRRPVTVILGEPIVPSREKAQSLLRRTRAAMEALLDEAQRSYPDQPAGPDDRWWLPAHLGGTPEEAAIGDAAHAAGRHQDGQEVTAPSFGSGPRPAPLNLTPRRPAPSAGTPRARPRTSGACGPAGHAQPPAPPSRRRCPAGRRRRPPAARPRSRADDRPGRLGRIRGPRSRGAGASRPPSPTPLGSGLNSTVPATTIGALDRPAAEPRVTACSAAQRATSSAGRPRGHRRASG